MQKAIDWFFKLLEFLVVVALVAMVVMVFGNVVLRYAFNSGILVSEEMSRYCFIWLTYIGAMIAMRERAELLHGRLDVSPAQSGGTLVCLEVPLDEKPL